MKVPPGAGQLAMLSTDATMIGRQMALALALMSAVSVGLRLPFLSVPLISDEGGYAYTAHWMERGLTLYRDLWFDRPQGIFLVYAAILNTLGESTEAIRLGAALYNAATVVLLFFLGRRLFGRRAGIAAAALFAIASASPMIEGFTANGELFMDLPVVVALSLATHRRWVLAGIVCSLAVVIKPTALASAAPALLALAYLEAAKIAPLDGFGLRLRAVVHSVARIALGGLIGLAPFIAHGLATDPEGYWYAVAGFRVESHSVFSAGQAVLGDLLQTAPSVLVALLPLWALAIAALWQRRRLTLSYGTIVSLAFVAGAAAGAAAGGYWYWHYYLGLLPGACLLAGEALSRLVGQARPGRIATGGLVVSTLVALAFNARLIGDTPDQTSWNLYRRPAYLASSEIAAYIRSHSGPRDRIYATFAEADLYHLAGRRSIGRQLYWTEINRVPGAYERLLKAFDDPKQRPLYVVEIDSELEKPGRASTFWSRVQRFYAPEKVIRGFTLYRLRSEAEA